MRKIIGLILMLAGILLIAAKFLYEKALEKIPYIADFDKTIIIIIGAVLIIIGFVLFKKRSLRYQSSPEVPIYSGNKVIGYRRR